MSVTVHFHNDPVTVSVLPSPGGAFIQIVCGDLTIYLGGQDDEAVSHAHGLAGDLMNACIALVRSRKDSGKAVA